MLTINQKFPNFALKSSLQNQVISDFAFKSEAGVAIHKNGETETKGNWMVIFSYPRDFTFVCPTELVAFEEVREQMEEEFDVTLIAFSTDSEFSHNGWRKADSRIEGLNYPILADTTHSLSKELGVYDEEAGLAFRATFIVDPEGIIRHVSVNDDKVGRNPAEIVRILGRLQTDELCAACSLGDTVGAELNLGGN